MSSHAKRVKVISIVGPGRSGSTLLARILGEIPGAINVGEVRWLWQRGIQEGRPCGCGAPPVRCPQWSNVLLHMFGELPRGMNRSGADQVVNDIVAAQRRLSRRLRRPQAIRSAGHDVGELAGLMRVRSATEDLVEALAVTTGAEVLIDASKRPLDAAIFAALKPVDHYVVHLVRDPRAVAFSWSRSKPLWTTLGETDRMARRTATSSAVRWVENSLGCDLLHRNVPADRWLSLRYEDFVAEPVPSVERLCAGFREPDPPCFQKSHTVHLEVGHTVAGNPTRFLTGPVRIRLDDEWRNAMTVRDMAVVTSLTNPWLRRYSYPLLPSR